MRMSVYVCMYVCMYVCVHKYIHIYTYIDALHNTGVGPPTGKWARTLWPQERRGAPLCRHGPEGRRAAYASDLLANSVLNVKIYVHVCPYALTVNIYPFPE
jgi:hypothetical protein